MFSQNNNKWYFPSKRSRIKKRRQILCSYHIPAQYRNGQEKTIEDIGSEIVQSTNIHKRPDEEEEFAFCKPLFCRPCYEKAEYRLFGYGKFRNVRDEDRRGKPPRCGGSGRIEFIYG